LIPLAAYLEERSINRTMAGFIFLISFGLNSSPLAANKK